MSSNLITREQCLQVIPRAMKNYAQGLGWKPLNGAEESLAIFSDPRSELHQVLVPLDEAYDDYAESVARVVERFAEFENREPREVLNHLLLPPADILSLREKSPETSTGDISLEHGSRLIEGMKKALLAVAHSVENPRPYHPRLSKDEAKQFLSQCRMTTAWGSFVLNVACIMDEQVTIPGVESTPFSRQVTSLFVRTLHALQHATIINDASKVVDWTTNHGISANLCEALLLLRPTGERAWMEMTTTWSRSMLPVDRQLTTQIQLRQEFFNLVEKLAPKLRSLPDSRPVQFFGFVDELRGSPAATENRPSGEVRLTLFDQEEELHVKIELNADDYATAGDAHLHRKPIMVTGVLHRQPRLNRIDQISNFGFIPIESSV